jgi:serine/threonine protein kinase
MALSPGDKLGPYEILAPIGKGGMGEVYRARDSRLNRDVGYQSFRGAVLGAGSQSHRRAEPFQHLHIA